MSPIKQGWIKDDDATSQDDKSAVLASEANEEADETVTEIDDDDDSIDLERAKPEVNLMGFQKVQAGREVNKTKPNETDVTDNFSGGNEEAVSLDIKNTRTTNASL